MPSARKRCSLWTVTTASKSTTEILPLKMLQRIRDEAHRFAITYFRNLHSKRNLESVLSEIEGVGKKKRIALMNKFGTIDRIMGASVEELSSVEGIGEALAKNIKDYFEEKL